MLLNCSLLVTQQSITHSLKINHRINSGIHEQQYFEDMSRTKMLSQEIPKSVNVQKNVYSTSILHLILPDRK